MKPRVPSFATLALLLVALGCQTPVVEREPRLPLSIALLPVQVAEGKRTVDDDVDPLELSIRLDPRRIHERLATTLEESCFARVTVLDGVTSSSQDRVQESVDADLLVECLVEYSPEIYTRGGNLYYVALGLHLIGGPFSYFVKDRSYLSPAEIVVQAHDVEKMLDDEASLADRRARILYANSKFDQVDLCFTERNENGGNYLLSLLVPVGFMAKETEKVRARVEETVVESLVTGIATEIQRKKTELLLPDALAARFYVDPETLTVESTADGYLRISGTVLHQPGPRDERLDRFVVLHREEREFEFGEPQLDEVTGSTARPFYRYPLVVDVPAVHLDKPVRVRIWDTDDNQRSFTIPLGNDEPPAD